MQRSAYSIKRHKYFNRAVDLMVLAVVLHFVRKAFHVPGVVVPVIELVLMLSSISFAIRYVVLAFSTRREK
jgi:hypothetical protein